MERTHPSTPYAALPAQQIKTILADFPAEQAQLLPLLHELQEQIGFIPPQAVPQIASALNISVAEVHAVLGFYTYFRTEPAATLQIEICQAEACRAMNAEQLTAAMEDYLNCKMGQKRADGQVELKKVYCLGLCTHGPTAQINEKPYVRLSPDSFKKVIEELLP